MAGEKNPETALIRHEVLYQGKVVDLEVDTIRLPSGRSAIREVVKHPGGVVAVPLLDDGKLLLIRQFRYPLQKYIFEFPAGKLDSGQTPLDTMKRELEEETGYQAADMRYEFSFHTSPGFCNEIIHLFLASGLTRVAQRLEEGEHISVESYTQDECLQMIQRGEIADAKTILGILWYRRQTLDR
ncbi:MAG: NUDIX hydrolase [Acidobacteriia bacterium]|nr:NUDIX hydrolase [Terriglobia bacterium]